ncbi:ubiquitin carboxyl-terminal hydrolase isozyme L3 [Salpingoeca rosetta]|uniref:Ubiquitin carboxyl-terminal hydrolase n=1 Tax=Salpingoeca rosetta (strain ATCC 50818 / BSB-021) TaxID=946362 RepID=F2U2G0_SALR5|nr:ubiquitin carboxyl-terminal hydrolase isozyme L3 [Salpingoeca rosetta]EGD81812.1 ubiquitin carboxyl-terminal hydrolase isozyme L3 [Salpingoeca rosetta]|eukprot:XP_004997016.1 ubiquitin carboxyl-terminal hydrolase isozyme L3 [Salpingoeca rosetta]
MSSKPRWLPLESNPDVLNKFVRNMGMSGEYQFTDVYGLDEALLAMVPRPVLAVVLLFPIGDAYEASNAAEAEEIRERGQVVSENLFSMKQTISNACGTVGVFHAIGNNLDKITLKEDSPLDKYFKACEGKSREEIGHMLEHAEGVSTAHEASANQGQTQAPPLEEQLDLHFIALVHKDGFLYELDGNKDFPINHGATTEERLLEDSATVIRKFMSRKPDDLRFTVMALTKA